MTAGELKRNNPARLLETSIKGMLPSSRLGENKVKIILYSGAEHPHAAQQPENYELRG